MTQTGVLMRSKTWSIVCCVAFGILWTSSVFAQVETQKTVATGSVAAEDRKKRLYCATPEQRARLYVDLANSNATDLAFLDEWLCSGLRDPDTLVRRAVASQIENSKGPLVFKTLPILLHLIEEEKDNNTRSAAFRAASRFGSGASMVVPFADKVLRNRKLDSGLRSSAAVALARIGKASDVFPLLKHHLLDESNDCGVRVRIAGAFGEMKDNKEALPALLSAFAKLSDDPSERGDECGPLLDWQILYAIEKLPPDKQAVPVLKSALVRRSPFLGREELRLTLIALAKIGPDAADAVPAIFDALPHLDECLTAEAPRAFREILGSKQAIRRLLELKAIAEENEEFGKVDAVTIVLNALSNP